MTLLKMTLAMGQVLLLLPKILQATKGLGSVLHVCVCEWDGSLFAARTLLCCSQELCLHGLLLYFLPNKIAAER